MEVTDPVVPLDTFLQDRFGAQAVDPPREAIDPMVRLLRREQFLRRWLPAIFVRRLSAGFARSNTVHPDTARALYAIVRAARARIVCATGTYWGFSTSILAAAVRDAGGTKVHSFDLYPRAGAHIAPSLRPWITLHRGQPSVESLPAVLAQHTPDLFFQDSRHDYEGVADELRMVAPRMAPTGIILLHDWSMDDVRRATHDALIGWNFACIATDDPQQLGVAWRTTPGSAS